MADDSFDCTYMTVSHSAQGLQVTVFDTVSAHGALQWCHSDDA